MGPALVRVSALTGLAGSVYGPLKVTSEGTFLDRDPSAHSWTETGLVSGKK